MKWLLGVLLVVVFACAGLLFAPVYMKPPVDPAWEVAATPTIPEGAVTVRFSGTSTLLFSDGQSQWLIDGWFTRVRPARLAFGTIAPDRHAITQGLQANGIETLDAVIPVHSHYDHAMDSPEVALRTGAVLMGSTSTANIGRGWGLPESRIQVFENRQPVQIGLFTITPIESKHFEFAQAAMRERALENTTISDPLVPPVGAFDYRLGKAYVLHVAHPKGRFVVVGSAGYEPGGLQGFEADALFLGIGGLGSQTQQYREAYWRETVDTVNPGRVIPIHYDSLTAPVDGPFQGPVLLMSLLSGGDETLLQFLKSKEASYPQLEFETLPRFDEVVLFE